MLRNVAPAPEERRCAGMQEPSRDAEPAPERGTWAGIRKPSRRAEAGQACGRCAGAESARGTRNPERARRRGGAAGRIREQTGRKARFPALCGAFCRNLDGKAIRRKNGLCIRVQAFFRQSKHEGRRPFGRLAPGEGSALRRETAEGSSKAFFALGSGGGLGRSAFVQPSLVQR